MWFRRAYRSAGPIGYGATQVTSYIVRPGDTLWSYASAITPAGHDVSETVDELIALNNLESGSLQAGQRIIVPVE